MSREGGPGLPVGERSPIILFDGVCNLCNASIQWVIRRDPEAVFRFAALQSGEAQRRLGRVASGIVIPDSIVLLDEEGVHVRSGAAIRIARHLGFPWNILGAAAIVPRPIRDSVYDFVSRNRYRWFGRQRSCMIPRPDLARRFLDADEVKG